MTCNREYWPGEDLGTRLTLLDLCTHVNCNELLFTYIDMVPTLHVRVSTNHISLGPRCYANLSTQQDAYWPIPGLISCAGMTGKWWPLSHAQNAVRWLALSKRSEEAPQKHRLLCLSFEDRSNRNHMYSIKCKFMIIINGCFIVVGVSRVSSMPLTQTILQPVYWTVNSGSDHVLVWLLMLSSTEMTKPLGKFLQLMNRVTCWCKIFTCDESPSMHPWSAYWQLMSGS